MTCSGQKTLTSCGPILALAAALAGCASANDDSAENPTADASPAPQSEVDATTAAACGGVSSASLEGSLADVLESVGSVWFGEFFEGSGQYALMLDVGSDPTCDFSVETQGNKLLLVFQDGMPAPGLHPVGAFSDESDTGVYAVIENDFGLDLGGASGGSVTLDEVEGCIRGRYDLSFEPVEDLELAGTLSGEFDGVVCR